MATAAEPIIGSGHQDADSGAGFEVTALDAEAAGEEEEPGD